MNSKSNQTYRLGFWAVVGFVLLLLNCQTFAQFSETKTIGNLTDATRATPDIPGQVSSTIEISNEKKNKIPGVIGKVKVTLTGVTHTHPDDLDFILVFDPEAAGNNQRLILGSDSGSSNDLNSVNIEFDDVLGKAMPDSAQITSGAFKTSNNGPLPAENLDNDQGYKGVVPAGDNITDLNAFVTTAGVSPNGKWTLFVFDDQSSDIGSIVSWTLEILTKPEFITDPGNIVIFEDLTDIAGKANTTAQRRTIFKTLNGKGGKTGLSLDISIVDGADKKIEAKNQNIVAVSGIAVTQAAAGDGKSQEFTLIVTPKANANGVVNVEVKIVNTAEGDSVKSEVTKKFTITVNSL